MNSEKKITNLMISHHALLETLFSVFRDNVEKKVGDPKKTLMKFKWEESKHIFTEESAIFKYNHWENKEVSELVEHLEKEHRIIMSMLSKFEENIPQKDDGDLINLYKLLVEHRKTEEEKLYPELERELSDEDKNIIIDRINEIPLQK